jgi:hypothetical protein
LLALAAVAGFGLFVNPLVGTMMAVPLLMLLARAYAECAPAFTLASWSARDLLVFQHLPKRTRIVFMVLAGVGLVAFLLAILIVIFGDEALESRAGISLPDGTELLAFTLLFFVALYTAELSLLARRQCGGVSPLVRQLWGTSAGLRMVVAIGAGYLMMSIAAKVALALLGGGGHDQPLRLAPVVTWPGRALLFFGEIVPTATWRLSGLAGPLAAALCVWLAVLIYRHLGAPRLAAGASTAPLSPLLLFGGTTLVTMLLVMVSAFASDASAARYLLPLLLSLPVTLYLLVEWGGTNFGGGRMARGGLLSLLTIGFAAASVAGDASILSPRSSGSPYPGLVEELESRDLETVVADYWTAYPLAFLSGGNLAVAPADGADRFPSISAAVRASGPQAYVFAEGYAPPEELRASLHADGVLEAVLEPSVGGPRYHLFTFER